MGGRTEVLQQRLRNRGKDVNSAIKESFSGIDVPPEWFGDGGIHLNSPP